MTFLQFTTFWGSRQGNLTSRAGKLCSSAEFSRGGLDKGGISRDRMILNFRDFFGSFGSKNEHVRITRREER